MRPATILDDDPYGNQSFHPVTSCRHTTRGSLIMPRVRPGGAPTAAAPSPFKSPVKSGPSLHSMRYELMRNRRIPLNDDKQEKAKRLQSRQAFHEAQMNSFKAAASPARKRRSMGANAGDGPQTPRDNGDSQDMYVGGSAVTPMKRVPILANFEEWMKMATDNVRDPSRTGHGAG